LISMSKTRAINRAACRQHLKKEQERSRWARERKMKLAERGILEPEVYEPEPGMKERFGRLLGKIFGGMR